MSYIIVLLVGLAAGLLSGVIGTGSSIVLLPILVFQFGPHEAVPILAIAGLMSNLAKMMSWWRDVNWRGFIAWTIPGAPAAALGARTLLVLPPHIVDGALGAFFLVMIPGQRWLRARKFKIGLWQLAVAGACVGFLTGVVLSTGPLSVPAWSAYGLTKGAFISTEAASSLPLMISKVITFQRLGALPIPSIVRGLIVGTSVMIGSVAGKSVVSRMSTHAFRHVMDIVMLCSGLFLLWSAVS